MRAPPACAGDLLRHLPAALRPLDQPPGAPGWNRAQMAGLLDDATVLRPASVLIGLREATVPRLLFTVRTAHLPAHAGQVAFPGGGRDPGDLDAIATALRESEEEVGLDPTLVTPLGYLDCFETISGYLVTPVVARVAERAVLRPTPGEVAEIFEVPFGFFLEPANLRRYVMDYRGHRRPMVEFVHGSHRIWGATAAMLLNLLERMESA